MALDLLEVLNAIVERDPRASGLDGTLSIGVRSSAGERWWEAAFGREVLTRFSDVRPSGARVVLLVGESEARAILYDDPLPDPPRLMEMRGDASMFERFLDRYFTQSTLLDVRAQNPSSPRKRKVRR